MICCMSHDNLVGYQIYQSYTRTMGCPLSITKTPYQVGIFDTYFFLSVQYPCSWSTLKSIFGQHQETSSRLDGFTIFSFVLLLDLLCATCESFKSYVAIFSPFEGPVALFYEFSWGCYLFIGRWSSPFVFLFSFGVVFVI